MKKVIIFSHESDIDGLGCVVLGKLVYKDIDYVLSPNIDVLEKKFRDCFEKGNLNNYDIIYITDLALYDPALSMVANSNLKDKVKLFDHHQRAIDDNMNRYSFTKIVERDETGKRCATDLFYEYLTTESLLKKTAARDLFVNLTKLEDTWQWKESGELGQKAHDLAILFNVIGLKKYVEDMTKILLNDENIFELTKEEQEIIQKKKDEYNKILKSFMDEIEYFIDEKNNKYGIVYADYEYRNEIPERIINTGNPNNIDYFITVALNNGENGSKSYRKIKDEFDVNEMAMIHGGGGHPGAANVPINKEQKAKALTLSKKEGLKYLADSVFE